MPDTSDSQIAFLKGQGSHQSAHLRGKDTGLDDQPGFLWGGVAVYDNQPVILMSGATLYHHIGNAFTRGSLDATPTDTLCYIFGYIESKDSTTAFVTSGETNLIASSKAYTSGKAPSSVSAYLTGPT